MITKYVKASILTSELKNLAHGVNCQNAMGSGVAKAIYSEHPKVKELYHAYCEQFQYRNKSELLGEIQLIRSGDKNIYNCFTQLNYGYDGKRYVDYVALMDCFKRLTEELKGSKLAIPKIGCGLAGGNWEFVEQLINDVTKNDLEVWVYEI